MDGCLVRGWRPRMPSAGVVGKGGFAAAERVGQGLPCRHEGQGHRVDAVPLACGRRAVREHVAEVAAAARAHLLGADHAVAGVRHVPQVGRVEWRGETGPACARVELGAGAEQRQPAEAADVGALAPVVEEHAAERRFGAVRQQDPAFLGAEGGGDRRAPGVVGRGQVEAGHGDGLPGRWRGPAEGCCQPAARAGCHPRACGWRRCHGTVSRYVQGAERQANGSPMASIELVLAMLLAVLASGYLQRILPVSLPLPLVQIALGAVITSVFDEGVALQPDIFFLLFLPPLLFLDGWRIPKDDLLRDSAMVLMLAFGLVFFTVFGAGLLLHWMIPAMPLPVAFALAAVVSPTDPVAVASIAKRSPIPRSLRQILEGESLLNDASGLVCFRFAVAAALTGGFSLAQATMSFLWVAAGGLAIGIGFTLLVNRAQMFLSRRLGEESG